MDSSLPPASSTTMSNEGGSSNDLALAGSSSYRRRRVGLVTGYMGQAADPAGVGAGPRARHEGADNLQLDPAGCGVVAVGHAAVSHGNQENGGSPGCLGAGNRMTRAPWLNVPAPRR